MQKSRCLSLCFPYLTHFSGECDHQYLYELCYNIYTEIPKECAFLKEFSGRETRSYIDGMVIKKLVHRDLAPLSEFQLRAPPELTEFYSKYIIVAKEEAEKICSETVTQAKSDLWRMERQVRVFVEISCRAE